MLKKWYSKNKVYCRVTMEPQCESLKAPQKRELLYHLDAKTRKTMPVSIFGKWSKMGKMAPASDLIPMSSGVLTWIIVFK